MVYQRKNISTTKRKNLTICLDPFVLLLPQILIICLSNLSILRLPDGWLFQKRAMRTEFDIYVFFTEHTKYNVQVLQCNYVYIICK